jgi:hypothetical protein
MKAAATITTLAVLLLTSSAFAQSGTRVEHHGMGDFLAGELDGLTIGPVGELVAAPVGMDRYFTPSLYIWSLAIDRKGRLVAGLGDDGGVVRLEGDTFVEIAQLPGELVLDVADTPEGLLAATGPEGRVYRLGGEAPAVVLDRDESSAWTLAPGAGGQWLAGFGPEAAVVRFDPGEEDATGEVIANYEASVARKLLRDGDRLWLATQGPSLIFQSTDDPDHPDRLRYDAGAHEIPDIVADGEGGLWFVVLNPGNPDLYEAPSSRLWHLPSEGSAEPVWQAELAIMSLGLGPDGSLLLGEIGASRVHRVTPDGRIGLWRDFGEGDASALLVDGETTWIGSSNLGDVFRLTEPDGGRGTFTSEPVATPAVARWGRLWVEGNDDGVRFSVRSGMRSAPDATWSGWSGWKSSGEAIDIPLADYIQYRISLEDAEVTGVNLSWARRNHVPRIRGILFEESATEMDWSDPEAAYNNANGNGKGQASLAYLHRNASIRIDAGDRDGDAIRATVEVREEGDDRWIPLVRETELLSVEWDTSRFTDGTWRARVTVRDRHSSAELESTPVVIDNSIPELEDARRDDDALIVKIRDDGSRLARVELRRGEEEAWQPIDPVDGVTDGDREDYRIELAADAVAVWIRVSDVAGNEAVFSPRLD